LQTERLLSQCFDDALSFASNLHATQARKSTRIPYISHLLTVASLVLEAGGTEDEAIAALLHDGPEDQGGQETLDEIRRRFGDQVADVVLACSDTLGDVNDGPKPPWQERKTAYLEHLASADASPLSKLAHAPQMNSLH